MIMIKWIFGKKYQNSNTFKTICNEYLFPKYWDQDNKETCTYSESKIDINDYEVDEQSQEESIEVQKIFQNKSRNRPNLKSKFCRIQNWANNFCFSALVVYSETEKRVRKPKKSIQINEDIKQENNEEKKQYFNQEFKEIKSDEVLHSSEETKKSKTSTEELKASKESKSNKSSTNNYTGKTNVNDVLGKDITTEDSRKSDEKIDFYSTSKRYIIFEDKNQADEFCKLTIFGVMPFKICSYKLLSSQEFQKYDFSPSQTIIFGHLLKCVGKPAIPSLNNLRPYAFLPMYSCEIKENKINE